MGDIFVTGVTGVVGGALVPRLLETRSERLTLLIRAADPDDLQRRFDEMRTHWRSLPDWQTERENRLRPVAGDTTRERLGLTPDLYDELAADLVGIVHAAANVKMNLPLETARSISIGSMREILALARHAAERTGSRPKLDYVSTMGVAGRLQGDIPETALDQPRSFHNTYEQAKAEAETILLEAMRENWPATIYRPSMITGDSRTGHALHFQIFHYLSDFLSGRHTRGWLPRPQGFTLDLIPSDYVALAVARAGARPESVGRILHLTSGADGAMPLPELSERMRTLLTQAGFRLPRVRQAPAAMFHIALSLAKPFLPAPARRRLSFLPIALSYMGDRQCFVNESSRAFLESLGVPWPHPREYTDLSLRHFIQHALLRKKSRPAAGDVS